MRNPPHLKAIQVRMDNRFPKESVIIEDFEKIPAGRRNDFARECMIAGYESLRGKIEAPSLLDHVQKKPEGDIQEKPTENPSDNKNSGVSFVGLVGNQT